MGDPPRPLGRLGQAVIALLGLVIVVNLVAVAVDLEQLSLVTDIRDGRRVSLQELRDSDDRVSATGLFQMGVYIAIAIAFLIWYGRAYRNTERLGADGHRFGKRWAIAYWFIPIVNLFRPKQVMNDIWRASDPELPAVAHHWRDRHVPALFHWWWATWLISSFISNIFFRNTLDTADNADEAVSTAQTFVFWDVVDLIPAVLLMVVVRRVTRRQEERRRRYESGTLERTAGPEDPHDPALTAPASSG